MDREKVIRAVDSCFDYWLEQHRCLQPLELEAVRQLKADALTLLKEQEVRELTMDEWREWKNNPKRNPICKLWEHDTSPMWVLNPKTIHELALLMGKLKLFTGKPTFEQCKAVKWDG